jgi:hypothetical protein
MLLYENHLDRNTMIISSEHKYFNKDIKKSQIHGYINSKSEVNQHRVKHLKLHINPISLVSHQTCKYFSTIIQIVLISLPCHRFVTKIHYASFRKENASHFHTHKECTKVLFLKGMDPGKIKQKYKTYIIFLSCHHFLKPGTRDQTHGLIYIRQALYF